MNNESIAKNYAEALLELATAAGARTEWAVLINGVAAAVEQDVTLQRFLAAPQVTEAHKIAMLGKALGDKAVVQESPWVCSLVVTFNTRKKPFDDQRVRKALSMSIDRWGGGENLGKVSSQRYVGGPYGFGSTETRVIYRIEPVRQRPAN